MTAKAILDVEVRDEAFRRLKAEYDRFQAAVQGLPGDWAKVGPAIASAQPAADKLVASTVDMSEGFDKIADRVDALYTPLERVSETVADINVNFVEALELLREQNETMLRVAEAVEEVADNTEEAADSGRKFLETTKSSGLAMTGLARHSKETAFWIKDATLSMLKWTGILGAVSGLLGAGGIWGIDRLALSAGSQRRAALGLGVTTGEQQAFGINFGRFVDPNSTLGAVADAQTDLSKRWAFAALGIKDYQNRDAADLAPEVMQRAKTVFDRNPTQQAADAYGLTQFFSMDDLRRLHNTPQDEVDQAAVRYRRDRAALAVDPRTQRAWQDLTNQLQRAGQQIENTFVSGLLPLAGPLGEVSKGFTDVVSAFLKAPQVKEWIDEAAGGLETFARYIGTPAFKEDVEGFVGAIERMWKAAERAIAWVDGMFPAAPAAPGSPGAPAPPAPGAPGAPVGAATPGSLLQDWQAHQRAINEANAPELMRRWQATKPVFELPVAAQADEDRAAGLLGLPLDFTRKIFALENGLNPDGSPRISSAGAIGAGQIMPANAQAWRINPLDTSANIMASTQELARLWTKYDGDRDKVAAAYNWGQGNLDNAIAAHGAGWRAFAPPETKKYLAGVDAGRPSPRNFADTPRFKPLPPNKVEITVRNNTGGSAVVTGSQVAAQ